MLDSRKGQALLAVIDSGSFEQAAALLHLTPSAVSQRVSALESELGTPLLVRSKPCRATPQGQRLLQYLRRSRLLEDEFMAELDGAALRPLSVALALNNDTLATWLLPGLAKVLIEEQILLDITVDDQDHTYALLSQGLALAGVSTQPTPMRGCQVTPLGVMRYRMLAAPTFVQRWFAGGFTREAARKAPVLVFDRKDTMQSEFLLRELGLPPDSYPCHYLPATDPFLRALELGLGYGMIPDLQLAQSATRAALIDLAPGRHSDVALYWHAWRVQSPRLERLSAQVIAAARQALLEP
jgi:LysR family transcriptional regulator (chromosome initiation inhibitor)